MNLPFSLGTVPLPDWMPGWVPVVLLIPVVLYALLALAMPFAVFGLRGRLEGLETQLDDLHAELRAVSLHLGPPPDTVRSREPVRGRAQPGGRSRAEPTLGWPRTTDD